MSHPLSTLRLHLPMRPVAACLMLVGLAGLAQPAAAQVTFFEKPPTAAELRQALMGTRGPAKATANSSTFLPPAGDTANRPSGVRTRGIVWQQQGLPANQPQPTGAQQSAAATVEQTVGQTGAAPAAGMPINFATGSAAITEDSFGFIETVAEVLRTDPSMSLVIEGHTDSTGSYKHNMVLSWERAMGVYRVLVERYGIEPTRLQPQGMGPTAPLPGTAPTDGSNRRVQFRLQG